MGYQYSLLGEAQIGFLLCVFRKAQDFKPFGGPSTDIFSSLFASILNNLYRLNLNNSRDSYIGQSLQLEMDRRRNEEGFNDLKINIQRLYEIVSIGIIDSREAA